MTDIRRGPLRARAATRELDVQGLREVTRDERLWCLLGRVYEPEGFPHFVVIEEGGRVLDVLVEVETFPTRQDLTCRLAASTWAAGPGAGEWYVPAPGTEVIIALPEGAIDFMPTVIAVLSSQDAPRGRDGNGPGPARGILVASVPLEVIAPQVSLGPVAGALQGAGLGKAIQDHFTALKNYVDGHVHTGVSTGISNSGGPLLPSPATPDVESDTIKVTP